MTDASEKVPEVDDIDDVPHAGSATAILAEPPHSLYVNLAAREAVNTFMEALGVRKSSGFGEGPAGGSAWSYSMDRTPGQPRGVEAVRGTRA